MIKYFFVFLLFTTIPLFGKVEMLTDEQISTLDTSKILDLLEKGGYKISKVSNIGDTALHLAAKKGDLTAVKLCVLVGLDPRHTNKNKDLALHHASALGDLSIVDYLIKSGSPLEWPNNLGQRPYHRALASNAQTVIDYFLQMGATYGDPFEDRLIALGYSLNQLDNAGNNALHKAVISGDNEVIHQLLDNGWDIDISNKSGQTPLILSVSHNKPEVCQLLLDYGALINQSDNKGYSPLHNAVLKKNSLLVKMLLKAGADCSSYNSKGLTPLHYAVAGNDLYSVLLLIEAGTDVNSLTKPTFWKEPWTAEDWGFYGDAPGVVIRKAGYLEPLASPLSIALLLHPQSSELHQLLRSAHAKEQYQEDKVCKTSLANYLKN